MKANKYLFILMICGMVGAGCSDSDSLSMDPPVVLYSSISERSLSYGQDITLSVTPENQDIDYDIQWYLRDEEGLNQEMIGTGNTIFYSAPNELGKYYISVNIANEHSSLIQEMGFIDVYGWAEEYFTSGNSAWKRFNEAIVFATDNGAIIDIPENKFYGGLATSISDFVPNEVINPPFSVISTIDLGNNFEKGDFVELYLEWENVESSLTFKSIRVQLYPKSSNEDVFWTAITSSYNTRTGDFNRANLNFTFLGDPEINIVAVDTNELKITVDEDKTIFGYINDTKICEIAIEDLILDLDQMSWELKNIFVVTESEITLSGVVLQ